MPVIAMTREIGSQGTDVAAAVASQLGIKVINAEIVSSSASGTLGVEQRAIQRYVDGSASILERWRIDKRKLSQLTSEEILRLGAEGNVLIRGWGAAALFRDVPQVISVRVCAPMTLRERLIMERLGTNDRELVREEIERYDAARAETMRALFNINRGDALLYHIVLNTGRLPIHACVKAICDLARDPEFTDDLAAQSIADKLLETKVRSFLAEKIGVEMATITVAAVNCKVVLGGVTSDGSLPARIESITRTIQGVQDIDNQIECVPSVSVRFDHEGY